MRVRLPLCLTLVCAISGAQTPPTSVALEAGKAIQKEIGPGEVHAFVIKVPAGQAVLGVVDQRGADVVVRVFDPTGKLVETLDSPNGPDGPEPWVLAAKPAGTWRLEVALGDPAAPRGRYEARIDEVISMETRAERQAHGDYPSPRLFRLWQELRQEGPGALARFETEAKGRGPLVEPTSGSPVGEVLLTFLLKGGPEVPYASVFGPSFGPGPETVMRRFEGTDLFFVTVRAPREARFSYAFRKGYPPMLGSMAQPPEIALGRLEPDPWNPYLVPGGSFLELPGAPPQPLAERAPGIPRGRMVNQVLQSQALGETRRLGIYLPPGYDLKAGPYPYAVVLDGELYGHGEEGPVPTPTILDNLIAQKRIPPMVAVLVDTQGTRRRDLPMHAPFADFLAKELVPWLRREYGAAQDPRLGTLVGSSLGGLCAAYCGLHHPEAFGNILSQSGSFWFTPGAFTSGSAFQSPTGGLMQELLNLKPQGQRFWMEVGSLESGEPVLPAGAHLLAQNRHFRDLLLAKGYEVSYREFSGGHDYLCWRGSLGEGIAALVGGRGRP